MTQDNSVGTSSKTCGCCANFHLNCTVISGAPFGEVFLGNDGFLNVPCFGSYRSNDRHLEHSVVLRESSALNLVHCRNNILEAVACGSRTNVHHVCISLKTHLGNKNVQLLCKVDINSGLSRDLLVVCKACGNSNLLVVLFLSGYEQNVLTLKSISDLIEELCILFTVLAAKNCEGQVDCFCNFLTLACF